MRIASARKEKVIAVRMYDIIKHKRDGGALTKEEIEYFVSGVTDGSVPDYQAAALLMAVFLRGMDARETAELTLAMARSGETADLSGIQGVKVDKHSTGGVGDKTTLIAGPVAAACGVKVAKMSGRGLGHTGGTVDKLESIPGLRTALPPREFVDTVNRVGLSIIGQSGNLAPADKKLYALRDVTATVENASLISASIMSKKIASGADRILLDVKVGSGSFMRTVEQAEHLARMMVDIGARAGRRTAALLTNMDVPLGFAVGNTLEVAEAVETLRGNGPEDLTRVSLARASGMLYLAGKGSRESCQSQAREALASGAALEKFALMVEVQGGDASAVRGLSPFPRAPFSRTVVSPRDGFITAMDAERCGTASVLLGAGRAKKEDPVDYEAGIRLLKKNGDAVSAGEPVALLYASREELFAAAEEVYLSSLSIGSEPPPETELILGRIEA